MAFSAPTVLSTRGAAAGPAQTGIEYPVSVSEGEPNSRPRMTAEDGDGRRVYGGGKMHRPAVIAEEQCGPFHQRRADAGVHASTGV